jgi:magnesium-transporting ATPase (P-type)
MHIFSSFVPCRSPLILFLFPSILAGTLTKNEMTTVAVLTAGGNAYRVTGTGYNPDGDVKQGEDPLPTDQRVTLRQLLLPAALCNDATLMPLVSAHAQNMLITQQITLPLQQLYLTPETAAPQGLAQATPLFSEAVHVSMNSATTAAGGSSSSGAGGSNGLIAGDAAAVAAAAADAAHPPPGADDPAARLPKHLSAKTPEVGAAITRALTTGSRMVEWNVTGDPTEAALLTLVMKAGMNLRTLNVLSQVVPRLATLPFSSELKYMATIHDLVNPETGRKHRILMVKGAPDVLLAKCVAQASGGSPWRSEPIESQRWLTANAGFAAEGLRVLALCWKELPISASAAAALPNTPEAEESVVISSDMVKDLQLNCLCAIVDPPREEAIRAVKSCHKAGITVAMITGDHKETARTIAGWLGIENEVVYTGPELEKMTDDELLNIVEDCQVYARASPTHKLRIVKALQKHGHICAMTGDGVNDAPALRQANVGVAMGITGTEVAKEAAKMTLLDDNFATLEQAVLQGRRTYANLRKLMAFLLATSVAQGLSIAIAMFIGQPAPLNAICILYVNMLTASSLGLVLAAEEAEPDTMTRPPRVQGKPLVGKQITWRTLFVGGLMIAAMLIQAWWTRSIGGSQAQANTIAMNTLVVSQVLYCLSCRSLSKTALSFEALYTNPWLTSMGMLNIALQCLITYAPGVTDVFGTAPLDGIAWLRILGFALIIFLLAEAEKVWGPKLVRPFILPCIKSISKVFGSGRRNAPKAYRMKQAEMVKMARSSRHITAGGVGGGNGEMLSPPGVLHPARASAGAGAAGVAPITMVPTAPSPVVPVALNAVASTPSVGAESVSNTAPAVTAKPQLEAAAAAATTVTEPAVSLESIEVTAATTTDGSNKA